MALTAFRGVERDHMIAGLQRGDAFAHFNHNTRAFVAEDGGEQPLWVGTGAGEFVGVAQACGLDFHQNFTGLGAFEVHFHNFQGLAGFQRDGGTVTAANASKINDGAAALILTSAEHAEKLGKKPIARLVSQATFSHEPEWFTTAPVNAMARAIERAGLKTSDIGLFEINEAFASVALRLQRDLDVPEEKLNVVGGAIAMGHPLGATGGCLVSTMLDELERRGQKRALLCMCVGGGMGIASIIERV